MPNHFGVGSGVVVDSNGKQSRQSDVVIYDHRLLPPILLAGDRGIFPIDSVLAVIEVKSELTATHYETLVDAAHCFFPPTQDNLKGLYIATPGNLTGPGGNPSAIYPLYAVFGYRADAKRDELERLEDQVPGGNNYIRLIGVLNKGVWTNQGFKYLDSNEGNNSVKFLLQLLNRLEETAKSRGLYRLQDWL